MNEFTPSPIYERARPDKFSFLIEISQLKCAFFLGKPISVLHQSNTQLPFDGPYQFKQTHIRNFRCLAGPAQFQ
jgi:hypothetical protein